MRERLRRLRRENEPAAGNAATDEPGLPAWFRARGERGAHWIEEDPSLAPKTVGELQDLTLLTATTGVTAARIESFERGHRHGDWALDEARAIDSSTLALIARDDALLELDLGTATYLDIETTGLSGGAGTVPFLVGLGAFRAGEVELWQGFVRSPEEEPAMLELAAERIRQSSGVVTFFGKSFDRHRLEDKMRMYGIEPPFADRPHLDLYHVCHRLYARACRDGRLNTMETRLCGVERTDDLSGAFAPAAWFDYLAGRAHRLEAVFRHNKDDVLSLITLAAHVGRAVLETRVSGEPLGGPACVRAAGLARLCAARKERDEALVWFDRALERGADCGRELAFERARVLRGLGREDDAHEALMDLVAADSSDRIAYEAWQQVAVQEEHARKDFTAAYVATLRAEGLVHLGGSRAPAELAKRRERLERKLTALAGDATTKVSSSESADLDH